MKSVQAPAPRHRHAWGWLFLAIVVGLLSAHSVGRAEFAAQLSPLETPTETPFFVPTDTPFAVATETPIIFPVEPSAFDTPTPEGGLPVDENNNLPLETPTPLLILPPIDRPIVLVEPTTSPEFADLLGVILHSAAAATAWIWFACGSLIFFIVAGIVAGLYLSQQHRNRYQIYTVVPEDRPNIALQKPEKPARPVPDDDIWPASLP